MTNFEKYKDELLSISSRGMVAINKKQKSLHDVKTSAALIVR